MDEKPKRRAWAYWLVLVVGLVILGMGASKFRKWKDLRQGEASANYLLEYPHAGPGWHDLPHGPQSVFMYQQEHTNVILRGSINNLIADINPAPDMDRDHVAQLMVDNTHDNMPGWTAETLDRVAEGQGTSFRVVRRAQKGQVVVTAFAVKGNTTVLISLSGRDEHTTAVDQAMAQFYDFLAQIRLKPADLSKL